MMKKQIVIALLVTAFLGTTGIAHAGDRSRGHHNGHYNGHSYDRHQRHNSHSRVRHHYSPYRHGAHYSYSYGHSDHYRGLKIATGALILGSIIHAASNHQRLDVAYRSRPVAASAHYYRVDSDGQCVEVSHNRQGQEVWTYVDSGYCY